MRFMPAGTATGGLPTDERRRALRRQADVDSRRRIADLEAFVDQLTSGGENKEVKRQRRRIIRHNCKVSLKVPIQRSSGFSDTWTVDHYDVKGRVLDLSTGGASLFTKDQLGTGQEVLVAIQWHDDKPISARAIVRWVRAMPEKGGHAAGVQFQGVSPKDQERIGQFLSRLDATAGL